MKSTPEEDRLAKRLAVVERDNAREGPPPEPDLEGCGASGCVVRTPTGMATVGRCRCDEAALRRMVSWQAREIARLRAAEEEARMLYDAAIESSANLREVISDRNATIARLRTVVTGLGGHPSCANRDEHQCEKRADCVRRPGHPGLCTVV